MAAAKKATKKASARTASKKTTKKGVTKSSGTPAKKKAAANKPAAKKVASSPAKKAVSAKKGGAKKSAKSSAAKPSVPKKTTKKEVTNKSVKKATTPSAKKTASKKETAPAKKAPVAPPPSKKIVVKKRKLTATAVKAAMQELPTTAFSPSTGTATNTPFSKKELAKFSDMIHQIREDNVRELEELSEQLREMTANEGGDDNTYSLHMAEQGTDAMEREKTFLQAQRTSDYIKKLDEALLRIHQEKFGLCRVCGLQLDSRRLMAVPVTQVCTVYKNTSKPCIPGKHFIETFVEDDD
ncbi:MAG: hypothetical protein AB7H80_07370 [Candidatus Kapaibacterium sp.]